MWDLWRRELPTLLRGERGAIKAWAMHVPACAIVLFWTGLQKALHGCYFRGEFLAFAITVVDDFAEPLVALFQFCA